MFPILILTGDAFTRGVQYGRQASQQIQHSIATYARLFAYRRGLNWTTAQVMAETYLPVLEEYVPDLLIELRGIAEGASRKLAEIVALNIRTELLAGTAASPAHPGYASAADHNRALGVPDDGECTTVIALPGATDLGQTLLAQTWDWHSHQRAACVILNIQSPDHPDLLTLTEAGMLAKIGLNRAGIGVCLNLLRSNCDGQAIGIPIHLLLRHILQTHSISLALQAVRQAPVGASSCISIADAYGQAISLELTPGGVGIIEPQDGWLVHTNHCVTDTGIADECAHDPASSSVPRYNRAIDLITHQRGTINSDSLMEILRDRQGAPNCICRKPDMHLPTLERTESVAGVVMDMSTQQMYVAPGIPCEVDFEAIAW